MSPFRTGAIWNFQIDKKRVFMCYFVQFKQHMDYIRSILDNEINIFDPRPTISYQNLRNPKHRFSAICEQEHSRRTGALFSTSNILSRSISSPVNGEYRNHAFYNPLPFQIIIYTMKSCLSFKTFHYNIFCGNLHVLFCLIGNHSILIVSDTFVK